MNARLKRIGEALRPFCYPQMQDCGAEAAIIAIKRELEDAAGEQKFPVDREGLFVAAEVIADWVEDA